MALELFRDFCTTDSINHNEILKEMMRLDDDDEKLLIPVLDALAEQSASPAKQQRSKIEEPWFFPHRPGSYNEQPIPRNLVRLVDANSRLKRLKGMSFNIFEHAFLERTERKQTSLIRKAIGCAIIQTLIVAVLFYHNIEAWIQDFSTSKDPLVWIVMMCTETVFFAKWYKESKSTRTFHSVFAKDVVQARKSDILPLQPKPINQYNRWSITIAVWCNNWVNRFLGILVVLFNPLFLLFSENPNEAILNGLALFFVLELDQEVSPDWDEFYLKDCIGSRMVDYILDDTNEHVEVTKFYPINPSHRTTSIISDDDKIYWCVHEFNTMDLDERQHNRRIQEAATAAMASAALNAAAAAEAAKHSNASINEQQHQQESLTSSQSSIDILTTLPGYVIAVWKRELSTKYTVTYYHIGGLKRHTFIQNVLQFDSSHKWEDSCWEQDSYSSNNEAKGIMCI